MSKKDTKKRILAQVGLPIPSPLPKALSASHLRYAGFIGFALALREGGGDVCDIGGFLRQLTAQLEMTYVKQPRSPNPQDLAFNLW